MAFREIMEGGNVTDEEMVQAVLNEARRQAARLRVDEDEVVSLSVGRLLQNDTFKKAENPRAYCRTTVRTVATDVYRKKARSPKQLGEYDDGHKANGEELGTNIPSDFNAVRNMTKAWFEIDWGSSNFKANILIDARRLFANRICNLVIEHVSASDVNVSFSDRIEFVEYCVYWSPEDELTPPAQVKATAIEIWAAIIPRLRTLAHADKGSKNLKQRDVIGAIASLGFNIASNTWAQGCSRGWKRVRALHSESVKLLVSS